MQEIAERKISLRFTSLRTTLILELLLLVPEPALIPGPGAQIPSLDQHVLSGIDIALILDLFDADTHAVFGKDDILLLELVRGDGRDLDGGEVDMVAYEGGESKDDEENEERCDFAARVVV